MTVVRIEYINVVGRKHSADQFDAFKKQTDDGRGTKASRLSPNAGVAGSASSPTSSSHLAALDALQCVPVLPNQMPVAPAECWVRSCL